jgi:RimJ/RimL family protein N-acetyltransferase
MSPDAQPIVNIRGERVALGPLRRDLIPTYQRWDTDFVTNRTTANARPVTLDQEAAAYDRAAMSEQNVFFTIYDLASWWPIGKTYLESVNLRNRKAEFGIVIGEEEYRGKGFGTEATRLVLDYAFTVLGLNNVMLVVYEFNLAGRRAYEKAGFREFGRRRQAHLMGGRWWDVIYMECLSSEFTSPVLGHIFVPDESG